MKRVVERRVFLQSAALSSTALFLPHIGLGQERDAEDRLFEISLAQWSLNRQFFGFLGRGRGGDAEKLDPQDFAMIAKNEF